MAGLLIFLLIWVVCGFVCASIYFIMCLKRGRLGGEDIRVMLIMFALGVISVFMFIAVCLDSLKGKVFWERKTK